MQLMTLSVWKLCVAISAMQKEIRRSNMLYAGYWANEVYCSGYFNYVWKRFLIISAEDCAGPITQEIYALRLVFGEFVKKRDDLENGHLFMLKALALLCQSYKNRDADHLLCFIAPDAPCIDTEELRKQVVALEKLELPDYALDCHTSEGRAMGRDDKHFNITENEALTPKVLSELDVLPFNFDETKQKYRLRVYSKNNRMVARTQRAEFLEGRDMPTCPEKIKAQYSRDPQPKVTVPVKKRIRTRTRTRTA